MKSRTLVVLGFLTAIAVGALLLMLPVSSPAHTWMKPMDALFTSCSAVCITGLTVIEPGRDLSLFGQTVLLVLVQLGCAGIMTIGTFFLVVAGRRLTLTSEFSLKDAYGTLGVKGLRPLVVWVVSSMVVIEAIGAWSLHELMSGGTGEGCSWFRAVFYAAMAFCNAGFSLDPGSAAVFGAHPPVLMTMAALTILGGLGFPVLYNLCTIRFWRRNLVTRGRVSLHTRVTLAATFALLVFTFAVFLALEWGNSMEPFAWHEKLSVVFFQSVTPRTCGFTVVPMTEMHPATRFLSEVLMFVGAAPGGAGGGVKITTVAVFFMTIAAICQGRRETVLFKRTIPETVVRDAIVIVMVFAAMLVLGMTALLIFERGENAPGFEALLFETVSAVSTTGLSCGNTTVALSIPGRVTLMVCMFVGRLGALAVVMLLAGRQDAPSIRYSREEIVVG